MKILQSTVKRIFYFLGNTLFPPECMICGEKIDIDLSKKVEVPFCEKCRVYFNRERGERCNNCYEEAENCTCMPKLLDKSGCQYLRKTVFYSPSKNSPTNKLFFKLKNQNIKYNSEYFAKILAKQLEKDLLFSGENKEDIILISLPRSYSRLAKFGFDQSKEIAKQISKITKINYLDCIKRSVFSNSEKKLTSKARQKRMSNSYKPKRNIEKIKGKHVVLFDDIATSGASMGAVCKICLDNGAKIVSGLAIGETIKEKKS